MFKSVSTSQQVRTYNPKGQNIVAAVNTDVKQHVDEGKTVSHVNRDWQIRQIIDVLWYRPCVCELHSANIQSTGVFWLYKPNEMARMAW